MRKILVVVAFLMIAGFAVYKTAMACGPSGRSRATLPRQYVQYRVRDMGVGESGWINRFAIRINVDRELGVDPGTEIMPEQTDCNNVKITRASDGFEIDIRAIPMNARVWKISNLSGYEDVVKLIE